MSNVAYFFTTETIKKKKKKSHVYKIVMDSRQSVEDLCLWKVDIYFNFLFWHILELMHCYMRIYTRIRGLNNWIYVYYRWSKDRESIKM